MPDNSAIIALAEASAVRQYRWQNRGRAPLGYLCGMAVAFAEAFRSLGGDPAVDAIAAPAAGDAERDVLDWYGNVLASAGLGLGSPSERLLAIFAILLGLGMRESSGKLCEGRDMSAENVAADTAEAGLFQVSYNSRNAHPQLQPLLTHFAGRDDLLTIFDDGVHCSVAFWTDWGEGPGRDFQALMKANPLLAVLYAGVLLRRAREHWGPIKRKEAEVTADAVQLLRAIAAAVAAE